jgi:hypothetical protein
MELRPWETIETIERMVARLVATSPAGEGLQLVGGLRYRLLDGSCRSSLDIDYHWDGDLKGKRDEILVLLEKKLLPEIRRRLGYDGSTVALAGPDADSPAVKSLALAVYKLDVPGSRIEIPVDVTRIATLDAPVARTIGGTVYLTASDADMVESKVIALVQRTFIQDRDLLDFFLFQAALPPDARARLKKKLTALSVPPTAVRKRLDGLRENAGVHARGVDRIIHEQVEGPAAANLKSAGGGKMICAAVLALLDKVVGKTRR